MLRIFDFSGWTGKFFSHEDGCFAVGIELQEQFVRAAAKVRDRPQLERAVTQVQGPVQTSALRMAGAALRHSLQEVVLVIGEVAVLVDGGQILVVLTIPENVKGRAPLITGLYAGTDKVGE